MSTSGRRVSSLAHHRRVVTRRKRTGVMLAILAVFAGVVGGGTASAVHDTGVFQLDRNAQTSDPGPAGLVAASHDWDQVCRDATATSATPLCNTPDPGSAGAASVSFSPDAHCPVAPQCTTANGNDASVYTGGGSKDF